MWDGKYDANGRRVVPPKVALPFQTVETVNESVQERQRSLFFAEPEQPGWRNRLVWGDKKYVLPAQFAALVPKVREFLRDRAFGETVDLTDAAIISAIATSVAQYLTVKTFATMLRGLVVEELSPLLEDEGRPLSVTEAFPFSRPTFEASKTVFNLVAADNDFEREFARFLQDAKDVRSFAKLLKRFGFMIEYTDSATNLRYYEPDFVAVDLDGVHYVIETKGQENIDVAFKDRAATIWCENATLLTDTAWVYFTVAQIEFGKLKPAVLSDAVLAFG